MPGEAPLALNQTPDVLVIGGGNAALCAALTAREAGASVLILEHAPREMRGGNSRHTRNLRLMHEGPTKLLGDSYSEKEYWDDLMRVTKGKTDEKLARTTIRLSSDLMPWMERHGVRFQPSLTGTLDLSRTNAFFLGGGKALLNSYYTTAEKLGVSVRYGAEVQELKRDGNEIREVLVSREGVMETFRPKTVVVASGGFQANIAWLKEIWGDAADNFIIRGTPYAKGRVLKNLLDQGIASVGDPSQFHAVAIDARAPKFDGGIVTRLDCVPFSIVVNQEAQRFYDEGQDMWPKRYAIWGRLVAQCAGQTAYSIFDAKSVNLFMPSVFPAKRADNLPGLAQQLGLDPIQLEATVAQYNSAVAAGSFNPRVLDDCHTDGLVPPKSHWARRIDTPPYYAYPLRPGITFTYLGIRIDEQARALTTDGGAMTNLFAAGEIMSGNILGEGYLAGFGMTLGSVFGRIAGKEAAHHAIK
ncbi:MAG: FAD-binding dehydrogenase [Verrucomicrobia bacterium]|nr:FAD-binding dehydrogenase [Verrucomicrobiota bacterium]